MNEMEKIMEKQEKIINIINYSKKQLEKAIDFYQKNKNNETMMKHFGYNITIELDNVIDELRKTQNLVIDYDLGGDNE